MRLQPGTPSERLAPRSAGCSSRRHGAEHARPTPCNPAPRDASVARDRQRVAELCPTPRTPRLRQGNGGAAGHAPGVVGRGACAQRSPAQRRVQPSEKAPLEQRAGPSRQSPAGPAPWQAQAQAARPSAASPRMLRAGRVAQSAARASARRGGAQKQRPCDQTGRARAGCAVGPTPLRCAQTHRVAAGRLRPAASPTGVVKAPQKCCSKLVGPSRGIGPWMNISTRWRAHPPPRRTRAGAGRATRRAAPAAGRMAHRR